MVRLASSTRTHEDLFLERYDRLVMIEMAAFARFE